MKQAQEMTQVRVDIPVDAESLHSNGNIARTFSDFRRSHGNTSSSASSQGVVESSTSPPTTSPPPSSSSPISSIPLDSQVARVLQRLYQTIEKNDIRLAEQDKRDEIKLEWQQVAQITDRLLLTFFVMITLTITGVVLLASPASVNV